MSTLLNQLRYVGQSLNEMSSKWALVGALAVGAHAEPRMTRDIDVALVVDDSSSHEDLINLLLQRGFTNPSLLMHTMPTIRMGIRVLTPAKMGIPIAVDILFASSSIEPEIVAGAIKIEILPGLFLPVASIGHLIAMKILAQDDSERMKDQIDIRHLLAVASDNDLAVAKHAIELIEMRGFNRGKDLMAEFRSIKPSSCK